MNDNISTQKALSIAFVATGCIMLVASFSVWLSIKPATAIAQDQSACTSKGYPPLDGDGANRDRWSTEWSVNEWLAYNGSLPIGASRWEVKGTMKQGDSIACFKEDWKLQQVVYAAAIGMNARRDAGEVYYRTADNKFHTSAGPKNRVKVSTKGVNVVNTTWNRTVTDKETTDKEQSFVVGDNWQEWVTGSASPAGMYGVQEHNTNGSSAYIPMKWKVTGLLE